MKELKFSYNWNNKLDCKYFTTFRLWLPNKFKKGEIINIKFIEKGKVSKQFEAKMIASIPLKLKDAPEILCCLDTGYSKKEFFDIVHRMYNKIAPDYKSKTFSFYLLKKV